jgi:PTH1 family peptidyl-tRNA hydrolase
VHVNVPVHFINEEKAPGIKRGGVLNIVRHEIELICDAAEIPDNVDIDLTGFDVGDSIHISHVALPKGAKSAITDRDFTIATVVAPSSLKSSEGDTTKTEGEVFAGQRRLASRASCPAFAGMTRYRGSAYAALGWPRQSRREYALHRHNVGFMALDVIAADARLFALEEEISGLGAEGRIGPEKILLLKPETFMNESGRSIRAAVDFYKLAPEDVTVFHDELDLAPMKVKVKRGGGTAGHNGLRSTDAHIGPDFPPRAARHRSSRPQGPGARLCPLEFPQERGTRSATCSARSVRRRNGSAKGDDVRFMNDVAMRLNQS